VKERIDVHRRNGRWSEYRQNYNATGPVTGIAQKSDRAPLDIGDS
jgi:hypothetical protein